MAKDGFSSKLGVIMAAAGGAVGLGNIWKFPYMLGQNGGGAFLLVYILCVMVFGIPVIMSEFLIGKCSGKSVHGAYRALVGNHHWDWLPVLTFVSTLLITGFYCVVTGWCLGYLYFAVMGFFRHLTPDTANMMFDTFVNSGWQPTVCAFFAIGLTVAVLWMGVGQGIERLSKILMPLLLVILLVLIVRVTMMEGANIGVSFLFASDLSKITPRMVLSAMGQCFYSLSIGLGALITYGAYMPKEQQVASSTIQIVVIDTLVAILAGCAIFPAVFALGFSPAEGPQLVFSVLPMVFDQMAGGRIFGVLFFALLGIAAVTSAMSLIEMLTASLVDRSAEKKHLMSRHQALLLSGALVLVVAVFCAWSMTDYATWLTWGGLTLFDWVDKVTSTVTLPLIALGTVIYFGWFVSRHIIDEEMNLLTIVKPWYAPLFRFAVQWLIPICILLIFLNGIGLV